MHISTNRKLTSLPRLEQMADAWGVTTRTVMRRLAENGTRFGELRVAQQLEMARRMLDDARYTVSDVGYLLGYGDPANVGREGVRKAAASSQGECSSISLPVISVTRGSVSTSRLNRKM